MKQQKRLWDWLVGANPRLVASEDTRGARLFTILMFIHIILVIMLTDVVMPNMNGRQLAERLQKEHSEMNVLYTSGYTENVIAHHGILDSGLNFIGKPYRLQALAKKIRELLNP